MVTIKDVAAQANVSIGTVSKYINGIRIREKNRIAIEQAVESLGYRINPTARALKTNRTMSIAVMLPNIASAYYPRIIRAMEALLDGFGYIVLIMDNHFNRDMERLKIDKMLDRHVDGFVIFPIDNEQENYRYILDQGIPLCVVDQYMSGLNCAQVVTDNEAATYAAALRLLDEGHRRIGVITGRQTNATAMERLKGFRRALTDAGLDMDERLVAYAPDFSESDGYAAMERLLALPEPPTALVTCNYYTTLGALSALGNSGEGDGKIRLVGFDYEKLPRISRRPMGMISQQIGLIAENAVRLLMDQIEGAERYDAPQLARIPATYTEWTLETIRGKP